MEPYLKKVTFAQVSANTFLAIFPKSFSSLSRAIDQSIFVVR